MFSGRGLVATDGADFRVDHIVGGGIMALLGSAASVLLLAASFYVLALMFGRPRDWPRALQVAAYSFAPVFLAGVLLILPDLVFVLIIAAAHGFYVQFIGVQYVLGIKEGDAAEYVALVIMLFMMASTFLGIFGSWAGVM